MASRITTVTFGAANTTAAWPVPSVTFGTAAWPIPSVTSGTANTTAAWPIPSVMITLADDAAVV